MRHLIFLIVLFSSNLLIGQDWIQVQEDQIPRRGKQIIEANNFILAKINDQEFKDILWSAPMESNENSRSSTILNVMLSDGSVDAFKIVEFKMMEPGLAKKFPEFKTFYGISLNNSLRSIRISYTDFGFRAVIRDPEGMHYIDHYQQNDKEFRIIYQKKDLIEPDPWECGVGSVKQAEKSASRFAGDCNLRTYRLACAATGEYTAFHGGTVSAGQSAIVDAFVRVNEIYEQDFTVRLILIANNDQLVYTNSSTDPYSNNSGGTMLGQNQTTIDNVIGDQNYDIGHVFSTGGGGIAGLGVLCVTGNKARGVTGLGSPTGDPFWIDYVAHEVGHQFGCNHTFNNSCGGNRNSSTAYEPGSGSTIMAYAGICSPNVQNNSDAYFHGISIEEASNIILNASCQNTITFNNNAPVVANLQNYTVPKSSFLALTASATDQDNDALTYCWEQFDAETGFTMPPSSMSAGGPLFRSLDPSSSPTRYLPSIDNIINGTSDTWEVLSEVNRTMNWRVTVRDNALMPGCIDTANMVITVDEDAGPFIVTSFDNPTTVLEGQVVTINWNVAGTDANDVNCANVDIFLSYDGGLTYPTTVLAGTPNDGQEDITIPPGITTQGRIMVKGSNNIFFDINNADIEIETGFPTFTLSVDPESGEACPGDSESITLNSSSLLGFTDPINLSLSGLPPGTNFIIASNPLSPGSSTNIFLDNFGLNTGNYDVTITGVADGMTKEAVFDLELLDNPAVPVLNSPSNMQGQVSLTPVLVWNPAAFATSYEYELTSSPNGVGVVETGIISETEIQIGTNLNPNTEYFWRVRSINDCSTSQWASNFSFTTTSCTSFLSTDVPKVIPGGRTNDFITSDLVLALDVVIDDLNVINLSGNHNNISDVEFTLTSPSNTTVTLFSGICNNEDDFNLNLDDDASSGSIPCPPTGGGTYQPTQSLSAFTGENSAGTWTLTIRNVNRGFGGDLDSWGLEVCYSSACELNITNSNATGTASIMDALDCAQTGQTITFSSSLANTTIDLGSMNMVIDKNLTISANPADNIKLTYSGNAQALIINSGVNLTLEGFEIESSSASNETLLNNGNLTLNNMTITNTMGNIQIVNSPNSLLNVQGNCNLEE